MMMGSIYMLYDFPHPVAVEFEGRQTIPTWCLIEMSLSQVGLQLM